MLENSKKDLSYLKETAELLDVADVLPIFNTSKVTFLDWYHKEKLPKDLVVRFGTTIKIRKYVLEKYLRGEVA